MMEETMTTQSPQSTADRIPSISRIPPAEQRDRKDRALKSVHKYVVMSTGMGFVPFPIVSQVTISGILLSMLTELCHEFDVKVSKHKMKTALASVLGGAHAGWISHYVMKPVYRFLPGISYGAGIVARPIAAGVITYAIGRLFLRHLESGAWSS